MDVETDATDAITVRIGQTRKFPITTLLRALNLFPVASPSGVQSVAWGELEGKLLAAPVVDQSTGEVLVEAGTIMRTAELRRIEKADLPEDVRGRAAVHALQHHAGDHPAVRRA